MILTGDGQYFSAGADLKEMATLDLSTGARDRPRGATCCLPAIAALRPPVIAAINGLALGGGLELALSADLRVAGDSAKLGAPGGQLRPHAGVRRDPAPPADRRASPRRRSSSLPGAMIPAAEALRIGLVNKSVPPVRSSGRPATSPTPSPRRRPRPSRLPSGPSTEGLAKPLAEGSSLETRLFASEVLTSSDLAEGILGVRRAPPAEVPGAVSDADRVLVHGRPGGVPRTRPAAFLQKEVAPIVADMDEREEFPAATVRRMQEEGYFGIPIPEEYGGLGLGKVGYCIFLGGARQGRRVRTG